MTNRERAQQIHDSLTAERDQYRRCGIPLRAAAAATVEELEAHLNLIDEVVAQENQALSVDRIAYPITREALVTLAQTLRRQHNRRAGVRALEQKYGHEAASEIVFRHSGRRIR